MLVTDTLTFADVRRRFGFKSIEIGRWVKPEERDRAAIAFNNALTDLMLTLQGPETLISLRETLGLQFGIGGRPGVSAHYIPNTRQLALAKNAGAGSLAHEWFHAFDHYIAPKAFHDVSRHHFGSCLFGKHGEPNEHPLNQRLFDCYYSILAVGDDHGPNPLVEASLKADRQHGTRYYAMPEELCARAFEAFVEDSGPVNRFLVRGTLGSAEAKAGLYPQGQQRRVINEAFERYFAGLGGALQKIPLKNC